MTSILVAAAAGLLVTLLGTPVAIRLFRAWGWGQRIREAWYGEGPEAHHAHIGKVGTPTMGGIVIIVGMSVAYVVARVTSARFSVAGAAVLLATMGLGLVGFLDDYLKIRHQRSLGLSKTTKFLGQAVVAVGFALLVAQLGHTHTQLSFIRPSRVQLGLVIFCIWAFVILAASSNAVNLTDGLDGLASGSSALVLAAYVFIAFWQDRHSCLTHPARTGCYGISGRAALDLAIIAAAALGAVAGFLWWNAAPARIFMGDTGSLALGGLLGALAITTSTQLLLVVLGGLFVLETTSVIVQVTAFQFFHRRLFRMAPVHHHFELAGWHEFTVIVRFWIVAGLSVAFGLGLFYADFLARGGNV
ncbi:MAG: phospho-N-acetylmuramoyl-pentapeptide-transferase [Actinomycetota bacterium]